MKRVAGITPMGLGIYEGIDDLVKLQDGSRPAVRQ